VTEPAEVAGDRRGAVDTIVWSREASSRMSSSAAKIRKRAEPAS
jgi:hypothetical protein